MRRATRRLLGSAVLLGLLSPSPLAATPTSAGDVATGAKRAAEIMACYVHHEAPVGMSLAIFHNGRLVQSRGFGWADLEQHLPTSPNTRFRLASVSKLITAGALARLSQDGRLDLDAPIRSYVPSFPEKPWRVSVRQVAAHIGGIRGYEDRDFAPATNIDQRRFATTDEAIGIFAADPLLWQPGTGYRYSTFGFTLLTAAIERASGKRYADYIRDDLLAPLGVANIAPDDPDRIVSGRGRFYEAGPDGSIANAAPVRSDYKVGGGGLIGTAEDLARYGSAFLKPGVFSEPTLRDLFTPQLRTDGRSTHVGLAWRIGADASLGRVYHHSGSLPGARSVLMLWPDQGLALAAMSNTGNAPHNAEDFADALSHVILDAPPAGTRKDRHAPPLALDLAFEGTEAATSRHLETRLTIPCNGTLQTPEYLRAELVRRGYAAPAALNIMGSYRRPGGGIVILAASRLGLHRIEIDAHGNSGVALDLTDKFQWQFTGHRFEVR